MNLLKILLGVVIVIAAVLYLHHAYEIGKQRAVTATVTVPIVKTTSQNVTFTSTERYAELKGTALMDTTSGTPAVPYIKYTDEKGNVATKQLIFADSRGCLPNAGDIPCVPSYAFQSAYPKLTTGEKIDVKGYIREDRFIVTTLSVTQ